MTYELLWQKIEKMKIPKTRIIMAKWDYDEILSYGVMTPVYKDGIRVDARQPCSLCGHKISSHGEIVVFVLNDQIEPYPAGCCSGWRSMRPGSRCGCQHFLMGDPTQ